MSGPTCLIFSWSFPDYCKMDVGDLAFVSLIKVRKMRKEGVVADFHSLARTEPRHVTCKVLQRLLQLLVHEGKDQGSCYWQFSKAIWRLPQLGPGETWWGKRQWAETQRRRL